MEGAFASFWERNGGLVRFGLPLSPAVQDPADGLTVQYFERARFELHPENPPAYFVELTLLGTAAYGQRPERYAPAFPCADQCDTFAATGHTLRGAFRRYWQAGGGATSTLLSGRSELASEGSAGTRTLRNGPTAGLGRPAWS